MKLTAAKEDKSVLVNRRTSSECKDLQYEKFAIKHINTLLLASYLATVVIALALSAYIHYLGEHQNREIRINIENFVQSELLKFKEYTNKNTESQQQHRWVYLQLLR